MSQLNCDRNGDGTAYLWAATTNATSLTANDLDGQPRSSKRRRRMRTRT
jgi:hypothetical protein